MVVLMVYALSVGVCYKSAITNWHLRRICLLLFYELWVYRRHCKMSMGQVLLGFTVWFDGLLLSFPKLFYSLFSYLFDLDRDCIFKQERHWSFGEEFVNFRMPLLISSMRFHLLFSSHLKYVQVWKISMLIMLILV